MTWSQTTTRTLSSLILLTTFCSSIPFTPTANAPPTTNSTNTSLLSPIEARHIDPLIVNVLLTETHLNLTAEFSPTHPRYMPIAPFSTFANAWCRQISTVIDHAGGADELWNGPQLDWNWQGFHVTYVPGDVKGATYGDLGTVALTVRERIRHFEDQGRYQEIEVLVSRMFWDEKVVLAVVDVWHDQPGGGEATVERERDGVKGVAVS